jgi:outer membrane immunogenic protein
MKNLLLASVGLLALGVASASAADIQRRAVMPTKAVEYVSPIYNWTGAYVGIQGGGGWGRSDYSFGSNARLNGGLIGGTLGYNWQNGPLVYGLETDLAFANISGSTGCGIGFSCSTRNNWLGTTRVRVGYAMDRWMPYVTGGFAYGGIKTSVAGADRSDTKGGWTVGAGIEAAIAGPWTAKVEYLHVDLGSADAAFGTTANYRSDLVRAGVNYRF